MSNERLYTQCKQRFKGVESFLRKVAFNLGNSPSQTEVKIISCIPIDVTDLQQKIISLEKELDAAKASSQNHDNAVVQTVMCKRINSTALVDHSRAKGSSQTAPIKLQEGSCLNRSESSPSGESGAMPVPSQLMNTCECWPSEASSEQNVNATSKKRGFFKRHRKKNAPARKDKCKTQLVYYAQAVNNPFAAYEPALEAKKLNGVQETTSQLLDESMYMSEMIKKQYKAVPMTGTFSATSQFSSPVCRDVDNSCELYSTEINRDPDLCSCFQGMFYNIDHSNNSAVSGYSYNYNTNTEFYDTSLYDMVPVKEKMPKINQCYSKMLKNKMPDHDTDERSRKKFRCHPTVVNYGSVPVAPYYYSRGPPKLINNKAKNGRNSPKRDSPTLSARKLVPEYSEESSKTCSIECGSIYMKQVNGKTQSTMEPLVSVTHKNAECLAVNMYNTECQTATTQNVEINTDLFEEKKTEETLDQIKVILQTVLTEVKTSAQIRKQPEQKPTKDAIVQKGMSQGNMPGCSSLLHSYTYSPFNINPYQASCSRQLNSGPYCFANMPHPPGKCFQNFPVFIHTPGRNPCTSCYRNSSHIPKRPSKQAATAATNTDREHTKETKKLIKEIYKSMAVNMEVPGKETSVTEYDDMKSTPRRSLNKVIHTPDRGSIAEGTKRSVKLNTPSRKASLKSKLPANTISLRSEIISSTDTEGYLRENRLQNYLKNLDNHRNNQNKIEEERFYEVSSSSSEEVEGEESNTNESEDDKAPVKLRNQVSNKKTVKKGLFSKMVNLFSAKNKRKTEQAQQIETDSEVSEDQSDDYQTIYTQNEPRDYRRASLPPQSDNSKIAYSRRKTTNRGNYKRRPCMEQEERRHWNEKLMFQDNRESCSSEGPRFADTRQRYKPVYFQNYETRRAFVDIDRVGNASKLYPVVCDSMKNVPKPQKGPSVPVKVPTKGLAWFKKHKPALRCGKQWKQLILEG